MPKTKLLEDFGRMIEVRKYLNKLIIIDFEMEKLEFEIFGKKLKFDKWLDFKDWIYIYEKILNLLENTKTSIKYFKNDFKTETFKVHHNTVGVKIIKENFKEKEYQHLFDIDDFHNFHVFVVKIQINLVYAADNKVKKGTESSADKSNLRRHNTRIDSNKPDIKEYFPAFTEITDADKIPSYKPSKLDAENELDAYSPEPVENVKIEINEKAISPTTPTKDNKNHVPKYKASPIIPSSHKNGSESKAGKTGVDKNDCRNRELRSLRSKRCDNKKTTIVLDGDSSEEEDEIEPIKHKKAKYEDNYSLSKKHPEDENLRKNEKKEIKIAKENDSHNKRIPQKNWLSKNDITHRSKTNHKISHKSKIKSTPTVGVETFSPKSTLKLKLTEEERKIIRKNDEKEIKKMQQVSEQIKEINKPPTIVEYKSLHHLSMDKIKDIYESNKEFFEKQFDQNVIKYKEKKSKFEFDADGLSHMFIHSIIEEKELMEMSKFLQNIFEPDSSVPEFTDIFFNLMVPEWVLLLYMDEYNLSRSEAVKYLKDQEESLICSQMESSVMQVSSPP